MTKESDFNSSSSAYGLNYLEFIDLPDRTKKKLMKLMARIMERAYRRGVQQALVLDEKEVIDPKFKHNLYAYRYKRSLDSSPGLDGFKSTSVERLEIEEPLGNLGLQ